MPYESGDKREGCAQAGLAPAGQRRNHILIVTGFALLIIYPFYNALMISFVPQNDYTTSPLMLFPKRIIFDSYQYVFNNRTTWSGFGVTVFVTIFGTAYSMVLTVTTLMR
jgi:putative aldouronate transport system permease protein